MLLDEFLKAPRKKRSKGAMIALQQKQIEALTAGLRKLSAQLETSKPVTQTVLINRRRARNHRPSASVRSFTPV